MTLSTDDLRDALTDAAHAPYDAAGAARLQGVRAKVRQARRRRAAALAGTGALAVAVVVAGAVLDGARPTSAPPASPTSSPTATPTAAAPALTPLPLLYRGQDVVAQLTGADDESPAKRVELPARSDGTVGVRCAASEGSNLPDGLQITLLPVRVGAVDPEGTVTVPCPADQEVQYAQLFTSARGPLSLDLHASFDRPVPPGTTFSVAVMGGQDLVDLSGLRAAPKGFSFLGSYALSDGWLYASGTADGGPKAGHEVVSGVEIAMEHERSVHLLVRCVGAQTLQAEVQFGSTSSVTCPAGERVTRTLDVPVPDSGDQRLRLSVQDADPGALVEVGVSAR